MPLVTYLLSVAALNLLSTVLLHFALNRPLGASAEMSSSKSVFRSMSHPLMLYFPLLAPTVQAALTRGLAVTFFGPSVASAWSREEGARFALTLWAATSAHGIWLDFTTFQISPRILVSWLVGSAVSASIAGALLPMAF